jgi:hypothetical protein
MLDTLLADTPPISSSCPQPSLRLAQEILLTLASYSYLTSAAEGGAEGYERLLYGSLDVVASWAEQDDIYKLFERLRVGTEIETHRAGYALLLGEQLVHHLDGRTLSALLLLCQV